MPKNKKYGVIDTMAKNIEDKIQEMVKLYNNGKTFTEISAAINIPRDTVSKLLKEMGIAPKNNSYLNRLNDREKKEICNLYLNDKWNEIYQKYKFMTKIEFII